MRFLWPEMLWLLLLLPLLAAAYVWLLARRKKTALVYASLALPRAALGPRQRLRRHIPPLLLLLALGSALLACARPSATVTLPSDTFTLVLAMDVSRSMLATDIQPTRIAAAQQAARNFIGGLPRSARLGIVSFAGSATLVLPPTDDRREMLDAIDRFQLQISTATGSGLLMALATLFPKDGIDPEAMAPESAAPSGPPVALGSYTHGAIILLSDGRRTTGPNPIDVARLAADRGVRVYTVGFGTENSSVSGGFWSYFMQLDADTLRAVAKATGGEYFQASSANDLSQVYRSLNTRFALERKETEISAIFAALAAVLLALACALSILWFRR